MYILGISCFYHDSAACLLKDGIVIAAAEEERFSRKKHDSSFPGKAIQFCLEYEAITGKDLDWVVFHEKPFLKFDRIARSVLIGYPRSFGLLYESSAQWLKNKLWIKAKIMELLGVEKSKILFSMHHISHASAAFFSSPFSEAAILTCDGVGEWQTTTLGRASGDWDGSGHNNIELFNEINFPNSLGLLYSVFTAFLGFEVNEGEYKVMGMSAFGKPRYTDKIYKIIKLAEDGSFKLNMEYFSFHYHASRSFNRRFCELFGESRSLESDFNPSYEKDLYYADIAASIQKVVEDALVQAAVYLQKKTGLKKLCLGGGVALNCVANSKILNKSGFDDVFVQPASGDSGAALGAALFVHHCFLKNKRSYIMENAYLGKEFSEFEIEKALNEKGLVYSKLEYDDLLKRTVDSLARQEVVGWFQGRAEWGPRALGNRSILADPRNSDMKEILNSRIKFRELFRPFAPSVISEKAGDYFDFDEDSGKYPLKFMLLTLAATQKNMIPAAVHVDGTSRVQLVERKDNELFYRLLERFCDKTGVAALLNTSFNLRGEPIVNTPSDAISVYLKSDIDVLVLGRFFLRKNT